MIYNFTTLSYFLVRVKELSLKLCIILYGCVALKSWPPPLKITRNNFLLHIFIFTSNWTKSKLRQPSNCFKKFTFTIVFLLKWLWRFYHRKVYFLNSTNYNFLWSFKRKILWAIWNRVSDENFLLILHLTLVTYASIINTLVVLWRHWSWR